MRLNTLTKHDPKTAKAILAAAALSQDEVPYVSANVGRFDTEIREVLSEAAKRLNISPEDSDYEDRIRAFLSQEVVSAIMDGRDNGEVRERMGREGRLPLSAYKVRFTKHAVKNARENEKYVRRVIARATDVQHILAEHSPNPEFSKGLTLIVEAQEAGTPQEHWMLIDAMRMNDLLIVDDVFRIFPQVVDLCDVNSPIEMLRKFVGIYGRDFTIEGSPAKKMFEQLTFYKSESDLKFGMVSGGEYEVSVTGTTFTFTDEAVQRLGVPKIGCYIVSAYSLDRAKYLRDRARYTSR